MKILIVDDSSTARQLTAKYLREYGNVEIIEATDGKDALEKICSDSEISLVMLDRYMPNMDGLECLRMIKSDPSRQHILVSMVTSENDMDERFKAVTEYAADYYITKPITPQALMRMFARFYPDS